MQLIAVILTSNRLHYANHTFSYNCCPSL